MPSTSLANDSVTCCTSFVVFAVFTLTSTPAFFNAFSARSAWILELASPALYMIPIVLASGTIDKSKSICLLIGTISVVPVTLPPGSLTLFTNFASFKSVTAVTVIGTSVVAFNNDWAAGVAIPSNRSGSSLINFSLILFKLSWLFWAF